MRNLLLGLALSALAAPCFGQTLVQAQPSFPVQPPAPRQFSITPPPAGLSGVGVGLPFRKWQDLLKKDDPADRRSPLVLSLTKPGGNAWAKSWEAKGKCLVPMPSMPLPENLDPKSALKTPAQYDDKMIVTPPPVCPLQTAQSGASKRK